jgi:hypothetical protein
VEGSLTASALASIFNAPCKLESHQIGAGESIHDLLWFARALIALKEEKKVCDSRIH